MSFKTFKSGRLNEEKELEDDLIVTGQFPSNDKINVYGKVCNVTANSGGGLNLGTVSGNVIQTYDNVSNGYKVIYHPLYKTHDICKWKDGKLVEIPISGNIRIIDSITMTVEETFLYVDCILSNGSIKYKEHILLPDGRIVLLPFMQYIACLIDIENGIVREIQYNGSMESVPVPGSTKLMHWGGFHIGDNKIISFPTSNLHIGLIDIDAMTFDFVLDISSYAEYTGLNAYSPGIPYGDEELLLVPHRAGNDFLLYNYKENRIVRTFEHSLPFPSTNAVWSGGVIVNGTAYIPPYSQPTPLSPVLGILNLNTGYFEYTIIPIDNDYTNASVYTKDGVYLENGWICFIPQYRDILLLNVMSHELRKLKIDMDERVSGMLILDDGRLLIHSLSKMAIVELPAL